MVSVDVPKVRTSFSTATCVLCRYHLTFMEYASSLTAILYLAILFVTLHLLSATAARWLTFQCFNHYLSVSVPQVGVEPTVAFPPHPKCGPYTNSGTEAFEQNTGIEPVSSAWEASILPLN